MFFIRLAYVFILLTLSGCLAKTPSSNEFIVSLNASVDINKNNFGDAAPLQVFIYKIKNIDNFNAVSPQELMDPDVSATNQNYQRLADMIIQPGQSKLLTLPLDSDGKNIAVVAAYRDITTNQWVATTHLTDRQKRRWFAPFTLTTPRIDVTLERSRVVIAEKKTS